MGLLEPEGVDDEWLRAPICSLCQSEMKRLSNSTEKRYIPVYACDGGDPRKPCDGRVVRYGLR